MFFKQILFIVQVQTLIQFFDSLESLRYFFLAVDQLSDMKTISQILKFLYNLF